MATRPWIHFMFAATLTIALAGCNSGSTFNVQNPPPPPPPPPQTVSIVFQPAPPGSTLIGTTTSLTAVVSNDSSNAGVDWSVTCRAGDCGTLSMAHTDSGQAVLYTPPSSFSSNSEVINIVGYATTDHSKNVLASINITAYGNNLSGTYVLQAQGANAGFPYQFAGVIVLDGNGRITAGQQTVNFTDPNTGSFVSKTDSDLTGTYFLGPDGRGTLTINTGDTDIDPDGLSPEIFSLVFLNNSRALIAAQPSNYFSSATAGLLPSGTGTMSLQTAATISPGGYALVVSGVDGSGTLPQAFGGILDIDSSNNVVSSGSVLNEIVSNGQGSIPPVTTAGVKPTGSVSVSGSGSGSLGGIATIVLDAAFPVIPEDFVFTGYIVDPAHIYLIESDGAMGTAGQAIAQSVPPGSFTSFSGKYVFGILGYDLTSGFPDTLTSAGWLDADAGVGYMDTSLQSYVNPITGDSGAQLSASFNATNTLDATGLGRVALKLSGFQPHFAPGFVPAFTFYLTGNAGPALVLASGGVNYPFVGAGIAYPQSASPLPLSGDYGLSFSQQNGAENDGTATINALPSSPGPGILSGIADSSLGLGGNQPFSGTFGAPDSHGLFAGTLQSPGSNAFLTTPFAVDFFAIDGDLGNPGGFFVETDLLSAASGQVSFGFYAQRCPLAEPPVVCGTAQPTTAQPTKKKGGTKRK